MSESSYTLVTDATALEACLEDVARHPVVGLDTETTGLDPFTSRVRLVQFATPERVYLIDCFAFDALGHPRLRDVLEADRPVKILHNAKFDVRMLGHHAGIRPRGIFDTYLASQLVSAGASGQSHSLKAVAERHLGISVDKSERLSDWSAELSEAQLAYAAEDARILIPLRAKLVEQIKKLSLVEVAKLEFDTAPTVARLENAGIYIDKARWLALCDVNDQAHKLIREQLARDFAAVMPQLTLFGEAEINLDSPQQVQDALHRMGIPVEGTRNVQLQSFAREHEVVKRLIEYRGVAKQLSSYGRAMLDHIHRVTGRVHPSFIQIGAPSGRFACMDPSVQQIPNAPEYRECIRAPEGRTLVISDYSQIELRILADWSQDAALLKAFQSGEDLHRVTASQMFNVPLDHVTKTQRTAAKSLNFGLLYGMGAQGLANRIDTSPLEAEQLIRKYFAAYQGVERWLREAGERAVRERESRTRSGRLVRFDFDDSDRSQVAATVRYGKNVPIQGCLGPDVRVHTDQGLWRIADLADRDCADLRVYDGETYVPFRAFPSGPKEAYRLTTADGRSLIASANHRFRVSTPDGTVWKRTDRLSTGELLIGVPRMPDQIETHPLAVASGTESHVPGPVPLAVASGCVLRSVPCWTSANVDWHAPGLGRVEAYRYVSVVSVEPLGREIEMYDIEVFDESHSFVADGLVTHNSSADITKLAMVMLDADLTDVDACMVNTVHDELVVECDAELADEVRARVERAMTVAGREYIKSIPVVVDATIADAWMK